MNTLKYRYLPLNLYLGYTSFVLMSLFLGPIKYKDLDYFVLLSYLFTLVFLFTLGYVAGARGIFRPPSESFENRRFSYEKIRRVLNALLILGVASSIWQWYSFLVSGGGLSLGSIGRSYLEFYEGYERGSASIDFFYILKVFDQGLIYILMLFFFYYYNVVGKYSRYAFLFLVSTYLLINILGTGKQKYLGDVIIFTFFTLAINIAAKRVKIKKTTYRNIVVGMVLVVLMFLEVLRQRYFAAGIGLDNIYIKAHPLVNWDDDSLVFSLVGYDYGLALGIFLGYFTSGLYGLYLSLTLPSDWCYLVGNSYSLGRIAEIVFFEKGTILESTYPYRVGVIYGWGLDKWHSLFAWLASDLTFFGVLFITPLFSYFYARLWLQAVNANSAFAGPLFIYLSMGLIFSYANNQIMHSLAGVIVLLVLLIGWGSSKKSYNKGHIRGLGEVYRDGVK